MEVPVINTTPFEVDSAILGQDGDPRATIIVKGTFALRPGETITPAGEQRPVTSGDAFTGDEEESSVSYESDLVPFKPRAEVLLVGSCHPPQEPVTECLVSLEVGPVTKRIRVVGDRVWEPVIGSFLVRKTSPVPFEQMPITYERAFGGEHHRENPVGVGSTKKTRARGTSLPNLEDPDRPITSPRQRPASLAFSAVGRAWEPRCRRAGTFDKRWLRDRHPRLPEDFDEGYHNSAPSDQQLPGFFRGDEEVRLRNLHPAVADYRFRLPAWRLSCAGETPDGIELVSLELDTLWIDMEREEAVLIWRGRTSGEPPVTLLVVDETEGVADHGGLLADAAAAEEAPLLEHEAAERELVLWEESSGG